MIRLTFFLVGGIALATLACTAGQQIGSRPGGEEGTPKSGGQLNEVQTTEQHTWDLSYRNTAGGQDYAYNSLLGFKTGPGVEYAEMVVQPELAERWEVSPDAKVYTFHLRKGVKFANLPPVTGRELTAADVKWSYEYWSRTGQFKDKKLPLGQLEFLFEGLEKVDTPDQYTVVVRFREPFVPFLNYAATYKNPVVPREIYEQDGHLQDRIVGTGPYILDTAASLKGSSMLWKKNPDYWDEGKPYLDSVRWLILSEKATAHAAFRAKQVDVLPSLEFHDSQEVIPANPNAVVQQYVQPRGYHLYFGRTGPGGGPLSDIRVRRAVALAIDRDAINKAAAGGQGAWAVPGAPYGTFTEAEARQLQKYDPEESRRLLAQAGYANGLELDWPYKLPNERQIFHELAQAQLKKVGINAPFRTMDTVTQRKFKYSGDYDLDEGGGLGQVVADMDSMLYGAYHSTSALNWAQLNDPELDRLVVAQRRELDPEKRRELFRAVGKRIVDLAWAVEVIYPPLWSVSHGYVKNYYSHFGNNNTGDVDRIWLDK